MSDYNKLKDSVENLELETMFINDEDKMNAVLSEANEISPYAPRIMSLSINPEKIGALIGPGGKNIKKIIEDTECEVNVDDDGLVTIAGANTEKCNEAVELVKAITKEYGEESVVTYYGLTPQEERQDNIKRFQDAPK